MVTLRAAGGAGAGLAARREWGPSLFRAVPERLARASLLSPRHGRRSSDSTLTTASGCAADTVVRDGRREGEGSGACRLRAQESTFIRQSRRNPTRVILQRWATATARLDGGEGRP